jgi:rRNA biogenesis protein RRP5
VRGKVVAVDPVLHHVQLSLKQSVIDKDYIAPLTYADLHVGQIVTGKVRKVEDFGVFILVENSSNVSGLCHRSEMADEKITDVKKLYDEGDAVKAIILKIDLERRRISFGLKASYFSNENGDDDNDDNHSDGMEGVIIPQDSNEAIGEAEEDRELLSGDVEEMESESDTSSSDEMSGGFEVLRQLSPEISQGVSLPASGFDWTGGIQDLEVQESMSDNDGRIITKKKKRRKAEIKVDMTGDLDANGPQSAADFERLLLGQPNSSYLWLSYMAFQLQISDVAKAREIAERAIRTIVHSRDTDNEVLNVWIAYLNLENTYGSDEAVEEVFQRACEHNDAEEMHSRLASIYIQSGKNEVSMFPSTSTHNIQSKNILESRHNPTNDGQEVFTGP